MNNTISNIPKPVNEPVYSYAPGTKERDLLKQAIAQLESQQLEIPLIIGGKEIRTGNTGTCIQPHNHNKVLATYHKAGPKEVQLAIEASQKAKHDWETLPYLQRASVFLKAADLLSGKYRYILNAATMLNQSKTAFQAEIDSACELVDFWRFNPYYMQELYKDRPLHSPYGTLNFVEYRALEGFVFAVTPFNFTSIGGNLCTAPAMMGNTVLWKPASTAVYAGYWIMQILHEAGLPDGVINFIPGSGSQVGNPVLDSPLFSGLHFTGSTAVFQGMWKTIGDQITKYKTYPRIVGETGGKDFMVVHASADIAATATAMVRGAFEFQGQKCSALSRVYVPRGIWPKIKEQVIDQLKTVKIGPIQDFSNFMNAVIDRDSFDNTKGYIDRARSSKEAKILFGGGCNDATGYFIEPTLIETTNPRYESMVEEIFAPVLTVFVYEDAEYEQALHLCDQSSIYGLTGCVFARDRYAIDLALDKLRHAAGNFYINDKPTGAVVGQQPFGGARGSGTNDKAGSMMNLTRWVSLRAIKENFIPPTDYRYPFMG
ncbi:MAG: L-glutamate gamma-semialdehyde dehydrogenase [Sedimentisphaerales bacterium]|nr:L-glutamate gamma-semialdehyde dehydrogenase [Sedimentisphaerales bacterium]